MLDRRSLLQLSAGLALGCGGHVRHRRRSIPPWHLWGNAQAVQVKSVGPSTPTFPITNQQLVNVSYKRPESWHFFWSAQLLSVTPAPAAGGLIYCNFQAQLGLGRSNIVIPTFVQTQFVPDTDVGQQRWGATAVGPARFAGDTQSNLTNEITAQSIQVVAALSYIQVPGPYTATIAVAFHVSPIVHVRPDWFLQDDEHNEGARFIGEELDGT